MLGATYLNYAGLAPLRPGSALRGLIPWEVLGNTQLPRLVARQQALRDAVARWLGVGERNVAYMTSTTAALQAVAATIDWRPGDVVLHPDGDFPANVFPWTGLVGRGVTAVAVRDWSAPFPAGTRLVAISTVDFSTGEERSWQEACARAHAAGAWTCVDAIQSAGVKPSRTDDVDFWAAGTQKWLASGVGLALLVVGDRALAAFEGPWRTYLGLADPRDLGSGPAESARRWELGWVTPTALLRFAASLSALERMGWATVEAEVRRRRDHLHERFLEMGYRVVSPPDRWSGIVSIDPSPLNAASVVHDGYRRRIVTAERAGLVRLSPHVFTSFRELDRALDWLWHLRGEPTTAAPRTAEAAER